MKLLIVLFCSTIALSGCATKQSSLLDGQSMSFLKTFHEDSVRNNESEGRVTNTLFAKENRQVDVILVKDVDKVAGARYLIEEPAYFERVFEPKTSAYFSVPANKPNCPNEVSPEQRKDSNESTEKRYFKTYANSKKVFGTCDSGSKYYVYYKVFMYCPQKNAFLSIDYYIREQDYNQSDETFIEGLRCN